MPRKPRIRLCQAGGGLSPSTFELTNIFDLSFLSGDQFYGETNRKQPTRMTHRVLITGVYPKELLTPLRGLADTIVGSSVGDLMTRDEVLRHAPEVDAIINQAELRVDEELIKSSPRLKIVANAALGTDNLNLRLLREHGIWATNLPDSFTDATADCTIGLLLCVVRRIAEADRFVRARKWRKFQPGIWDGALLRNRTIGIVGYGSIGEAVAARAAAFGMKVLFTRRTPVRDPRYRSLDELLTASDVVSVHTPLNGDSMHLLNRHRIRLMKPGSFLINIGRGKVIEEAALVEALKAGHLAGAGLDVFENEPNVHPDLLKMENVVLTPHIGGGTIESRTEGQRIAIQNVSNVIQGRPPLTPLFSLSTERTRG